MREATLCLLVQGEPVEQVLLGFKKRGFGQGKFTGIGGKVEPGERVIAAALRELGEEIGVALSEAQLKPMGVITFHFPAKPAWDQKVHIFLVRNWESAPCEGDEMEPQWFQRDMLPFAQMWQDAFYWLPLKEENDLDDTQEFFNNDNETVQDYRITVHSTG